MKGFYVSDGLRLDEFDLSTDKLIGSMESKVSMLMEAADADTAQLARELRRILEELRGLLR